MNRGSYKEIAPDLGGTLFVPFSLREHQGTPTRKGLSSWGEHFRGTPGNTSRGVGGTPPPPFRGGSPPREQPIGLDVRDTTLWEICKMMILAWLLMASLNMGATVNQQAERGPSMQATTTDPPPPITFSSDSEDGRCVGAEGLLAAHSPGWSVVRMSRIMYRESRCMPHVRSGSGAVGLLQVMTSNCKYLSEQMGESCSADKLRNPDFNIRAARELFQYDGYGPWKV